MMWGQRGACSTMSGWYRVISERALLINWTGPRTGGLPARPSNFGGRRTCPARGFVPWPLWTPRLRPA